LTLEHSHTSVQNAEPSQTCMSQSEIPPAERPRLLSKSVKAVHAWGLSGAWNLCNPLL